MRRGQQIVIVRAEARIIQRDGRIDLAAMITIPPRAAGATEVGWDCAAQGIRCGERIK